jgi:hypothetical protein
MNYDNDYLGTNNSQHPANQEQYEETVFESNILWDCLDYAKDTKDFELIENAITLQNTIIEKAILELDFLIDLNHQTENTYMKNRLVKLRTDLKFNQK